MEETIFSPESILKKKYIRGLLVILLLGIILEIWLVNRLSTAGEQIAKLDQAASALRLENEILKNQIDKRASLSEIEKQAKNLGFEKIRNIEYIKPSGVSLSQ